MLPLGSIANILVALILVGFWLVAFVIFYHLSRFGVGTLPKKLSALFLVGSLGLFVWVILSYHNLDFNLLRP